VIEDLDYILNKLKQKRGIDFSSYRPNMLRRRIASRLARLGMKDLALYLEQLENDPAECDHLIDAIAINVSSFFRDPIVYEVLAQKILPELIDVKRRTGSREIRVWSAGCAAGEEPYSLAILIHEVLKKDDSNWKVYIFGTDIDKKALQRAEQATYSRDSLVNTKLGIVDTHFKPVNEGFQLNRSIRDMVSFSLDDLTSEKTFSPAESVFGEFDLIVCRNVLIYFNQELQTRVMNKFIRSLASRGYLVLGDSEAIGHQFESKVQVVDRRNRIYKNRL